MNTEKALEFLDNDVMTLSIIDCKVDEFYGKIEGVEELLKHGEKATIENVELKKFKKMWKELSMYRVYKEPNSIEYPYNKYLDDTAKAIERKHFPKEAKD